MNTEFSLKLYPVKRNNPLPFTKPQIEKRQTAINLPPRFNSQIDLNLYLIPFTKPKNNKEIKHKKIEQETINTEDEPSDSSDTKIKISLTIPSDKDDCIIIPSGIEDIEDTDTETDDDIVMLSPKNVLPSNEEIHLLSDDNIVISSDGDYITTDSGDVDYLSTDNDNDIIITRNSDINNEKITNLAIDDIVISSDEGKIILLSDSDSNSLKSANYNNRILSDSENSVNEIMNNNYITGKKRKLPDVNPNKIRKKKKRKITNKHKIYETNEYNNKEMSTSYKPNNIKHNITIKEIKSKSKKKNNKLIKKENKQKQEKEDQFDLLEVNNFAKIFKKITSQSPPQRIIEDFYKFKKYRNNTSLEWQSKEYLDTFNYLHKRYKENQVIEITMNILGCEQNMIHNKMNTIIPPKNITSPKSNQINHTSNKRNSPKPWKSLLRKNKSKQGKYKNSRVIDLIAPKSLIYSWSHAWISFSNYLNIDKITLNKLHELYFSSRWVRERYITIKNKSTEFGDYGLVEKLEEHIPNDKHMYMSYIIACITEKPLYNIRKYLMERETLVIFENAKKSSLGANLYLETYQENVKNEMKVYLSSQKQKILTNKQFPKEILKLKEQYQESQEQHDLELLRYYCEQSKILIQKQSQLINSGGFFVLNTIDNEEIEEFTWITENKLSPQLEEQINDTEFLAGCNCIGDCSSNIKSCECMKEMKATAAHKYLPPYTKSGILNPKFEVGFPIYECNSACNCGKSCSNRVVQKSSELNLFIFKDRRKGWGVKTMDLIEKGKFVCEYMGELITSEEAEERGKDYDEGGLSFLLDLDLYGRDCKYTLDAKRYGNIARFFNHSCEPNIQIFYVFIDVLDWRRPKICFFAKRDIQPGEEITFDYKYDVTGKPKLRCCCGTPSCRQWLV